MKQKTKLYLKLIGIKFPLEKHEIQLNSEVVFSDPFYYVKSGRCKIIEFAKDEQCLYDFKVLIPGIGTGYIYMQNIEALHG